MNQENGFMFAQPLLRKPSFGALGQTTVNVAPAPAAAPAASQGLPLGPIVFSLGTILLLTELAGVTHVTPWFKKILGLGKRK